jgi:hypothetical protein
MVREWLRRWLPSEQALRRQRALRWLGPLLCRPWLWHVNRRSVAAGAAIGVFFGLMIPLLQIAFAAALAILLRANLPVAAATTLVSNPLTYVPILVFAYRTGSAVLGEPVDERKAAALATPEDAPASAESWGRRVVDVGKPLFVGLALFAVTGAVVAWLAVNMLWMLAVYVRRRRRDLRAGAGPPKAN